VLPNKAIGNGVLFPIVAVEKIGNNGRQLPKTLCGSQKSWFVAIVAFLSLLTIHKSNKKERKRLYTRIREKTTWATARATLAERRWSFA